MAGRYSWRPPARRRRSARASSWAPPETGCYREYQEREEQAYQQREQTRLMEQQLEERRRQNRILRELEYQRIDAERRRRSRGW